MSRLWKTTIFVMLSFLLFSLMFLVSTTPAYALSTEDLIENNAENPFVIDNKQDFLDLENLVNTGSTMLGKHFVLAIDIDLTSDTFKPIGSSINMFQGNFDGSNHKVTLNINTNTTYTGLFGYIGNNGAVKNVVVAGTITARDYLGGIAGYSAGTIANCINTASLTAISSETIIVGGICGENIGKIDSCVNSGNIIANKYCGGIVGKNLSTNQGVFSSINLGDIDVTENYLNATSVGGLVGESRAILNNSYNYAFVNATGNRIGALVGYLLAAPQGTGYCYNINAKSARLTIGQSNIVEPTTFDTKTLYDFLEKTVELSNDSMKSFDYVQGYGFLPYPRALSENLEIKEKLKTCIFNEGTGTELAPFIMRNLRQWGLFLTNSYLFSYDNVYIKLATNLVLTQTQPLFTMENPFKGVFEGDNYTLTYNISDANRVGLFSYVNGGTIKNLTLYGSVTATGDSAGAIAGCADASLFQNIVNNCTVTAKNYSGGIVGFVPKDNVVFNNVKNYGAISAENQVGGILGEGKSVTLTDAENYGNITAITSSVNNNIGGIVGKISSNGSIDKAFNNGTVSAYKALNVGGIIGYGANVNIFMVANLNNVVGKNNVGGIIGSSQNDGESFVNSAMCVANVTGAINVAGVLGNNIGNQNAIDNSYFAGKLLEVNEATINKATFKPLSSSTNIINSYFNGDLLTDFDGSAKNYIELTDNLFSVTAEDSIWLSKEMTADYGYYPIIKLNALLNNTVIINNKLKINYFDGGKGTEVAPYLIANEQTLRNFEFLNNNYDSFNYRTKAYKLTNDINLKRSHNTIGSSSSPFNGKFDGDYKIINNLNISGGEYTGFFASLDANAIINKLFIESGTIIGTNYVGTIAGYTSFGAVINDSYSNAKLTALHDVGGLVGVNYGQIKDSFFAGRISGGTNIGGIAGKNGQFNNKGIVTQCFSLGYIAGYGNVGGIVGLNQGDISICQVSGTVHLTYNNTYSGGIAGESLLGNIESCYVIAVLSTQSGGSKIGGLVGQFTNTGDSILKFCFYNQAITTATTPYYIVNTAWPHSGTTKNTQQMLDNAFLGNLDYKFNFSLSSSKDSDFAPRIKSFINTGVERKEFYSSESAKLRVFDWDNTSDDEWGGEQNPYIISTPSQLYKLSNLVATYKYSYSGNYFSLENSLDMNGLVFMPIGGFISSSNSNNYMFNGVFDGNGHSISNLSINRTSNYIGLFGYTGSSFVLKNLTLDSSCSFVTSGQYAGSFVGYNGGKIDRCVSYADVSADNYIGGLSAYSAINTQVTNSVFYGTIPTATYSYGVLGIIPSAGITINTSNTWYVYKNDSQENIKVSSLPYMHNDYGSVLYVDKLGSLSIIVDTLTQVNVNILTFQIDADAYYSGAVMASNDSLIYSGSSFSPYASFGGSQNVCFVRFCQTARLNFINPAESNFMENYLNNYGKGNFYKGQQVDFTIKVKKGYYLQYLPEYENNYQLRNVSTDIVIRFTMGSNATSNNFDIPIAIKSASSYVSVTCSELVENNIYNGLAKTVQVEFTDIFDHYTLSYYYGVEKNSVSGLKNAGEYVVYTYLYAIGNRSLFFGIMENNFTILPKQLALDDSIDAINNYWSSVVAVKSYDGTNYYIGKEISNQYVLTIESNDNAYLNIKADITWENANAGDNITAVVANYALSGTSAVNYYINPDLTLNLVNMGKIDKKILIVTIANNDLSMEFSGNSPIIKNPQVSGSMGSTRLVWSFSKLNEDDQPDIEWENLVVKTYNVGHYSINVSTDDTNNYSIGFGTNSYLFVILPKSINSIEYLDYADKCYTGSVVSAGIKAIYNTPKGGIAFAAISYYKDSISVENKIDGVINAGNYIAVPSITDTNYKLGSEISNLSFSVARSALGGEIAFDVDTVDLTVDDVREIEFLSDIYDASLSIEIVGSNRAKIILITEENNYYLKPTAYSISGSVTYRIVATNATNYEDRYSADKTVDITPLSIYVGVKNRTHSYGDVIELELCYSRDIEQNDEINLEEVENLAGYKPSNYQIAYSTFQADKSYIVNIDGGDFDGYKIYNADTCSIDIVKRKIKVTVPAEMTTNTKVYGNSDSVIKYIVIDSATNRQITHLPSGEQLVLTGKLSRDIGETCGKYAISQGTLNQENNSNYRITTDFRGEYTITQRPLRLYIPIVQKYYDRAEPSIVPLLEQGYSFAFDDTLRLITFTIIRQAGENVGRYNYSVTDSSGGKNYRIDHIRNDNYFEILPGSPDLTFDLENILYYGNKVSSVKIIGKASYDSKIIDGTFSWAQPNQTATAINTIIATVKFVPLNNNFTQAECLTELTVEKRRINVSFVGELHYVYNGSEQCNIDTQFSNLYGSDTINPIVTIDSTPIKAGFYKYFVAIESDKYLIVNDDFVNFTIHKKNVTVNLSNVNIVEGEKANFVVTYDGFIDGDNENTIPSKAIIADIPTACGKYAVVASGARSDNYNFIYKKGSLTINQKKIVKDNITVNGVIKAGVTVEAKTYKSDNIQFKVAANTIDKKSGSNIIKPSLKTLEEFIGINFSERIYGDYSYSVNLSGVMASDKIIYVFSDDGEVIKLKDYTLSDDGKTVTFNSTHIKGIAIYSQKDTTEIIKGYLPLMGACLGIVVVILIIILSIKIKSKKNKARQAYLKSLDN